MRKFVKIKLENSKFTCSEIGYKQKAERFGIESERKPKLEIYSKNMPKFIMGKIWKNYNHNPTGVDDDETVSLLVDIGSSGEGVVRPGVCSWVPSARSSIQPDEPVLR